MLTPDVAPIRRRVFVTGGTGYMGRRLIMALLARGHEVRALVRSGRERELPAGALAVPGHALDQTTYAARVPPADTFVHLVGVSRPSPAKAALFRTIDLASVREAVAAATRCSCRSTGCSACCRRRARAPGGWGS